MTTNTLSTFTFAAPLGSSLLLRSVTIRVIAIDGEPWLVAKDVCTALDMDTYAGTQRWTAGLDATEKMKVTKRILPQLFCGTPAGSFTLISESGLYKMVLRSNKPQAKPFQDWVTKVVLLAIRKDGAYIMGEEKVVTGELSEDTSTPGIRLHLRYQ